MIYKNIINFSKGWADLDSDVNTLIQGFVWRGEVGKVLLGEEVSRGELLYPVLTTLDTIAEWKVSDANDVVTMPALCMALEDGADKTRIKVLFKGYVKNTDFDFGTRATGTVTTSGIPINGELLTLNGKIFEVTEGEDIAAGSDYAIDCSAEMTQSVMETALTAALVLALADDALGFTYSAWSSHVITFTANGDHKGYAGNLLTLVEAFTNATVSGAVFTSGVEGGELYASETKGDFTLTKPTKVMVQSVGYALEAEKFFFNPLPPTNEVVKVTEHGAGAIGTSFAPRTYRKILSDGTIVTEIVVDITGLLCKGDAQGDAIGLASGAAYIGRYIVATYGVVFRIEMICLVTPTQDVATFEQDVDLMAENDGDITYDGAVDDTVIAAARDWVAGEVAITNVPKLTANDYFYLGEGDVGATTGKYGAGQFIIRLFGMPVQS